MVVHEEGDGKVEQHDALTEWVGSGEKEEEVRMRTAMKRAAGDLLPALSFRYVTEFESLFDGGPCANKGPFPPMRAG